MTHILITSLNYWPEETGIAPYSTAVAEHLASVGYRVTVVAGMPHYPRWRIDAGYRGRGAHVERRNGVEIRRRAHYVPSRQSALRRAAYEATSLAMALEARRVERPDAVIGIVPSLSGGVAARVAAARFSVPYGIVFQDLTGPGAAQSGLSSGHVAALVREAEAWVASRASVVGIIAEGFRAYVESLGVAPERIRRLRNWDRSEPPTVSREAMRAELGWPDDATVCLHAGNMGAKQGLENVIEAARLAQSSAAPLLFVLMGDGNRRRELQQLAWRHRLANVQFLPLQPADRVSSVLAAADVLLVNQLPSVADMSLPSKLSAYFASGRPVVAACAAGSETAREITDSGAGLLVPAASPAQLLEGILRVASDPGLAAHLARRGLTWRQWMLSSDAALRSYEQFVAQTLSAGSHGRVHTPYRAPLRARGTPARPAAARGDERGQRRAA